MSDRWNLLAVKAFEAKKQRKFYEDQEVRLLDELKRLANYRTTVGDRFVLVKEKRIGNVDYQSIPELLNVNLDLYRKSAVEIYRLLEK